MTGRGTGTGTLARAALTATALAALAAGGCNADRTPVQPADPVVDVSPSRAWLLTGDTLHLHVVVRDGEGGVVAGPTVSFASSHPDRLEVSGEGVVRALDAGPATVTVSAEGETGTTDFTVAPGGGERVPELAVVDRLVIELIEEWDIPGAVVGVTRDERLVLLRGYGYADREAQEPMGPDARFRVASLSKPLAATAALQLAEEGALDLDAPVRDILDGLDPPPESSPDPRLDDVTVRHLIHHQGGWDRGESGDWTWPPYVQEAADDLGIPGPPTAEELLGWILGRPLDFDPGARYAYSNIGYSALARVIERVAGRGYEDHVREELLAPAGAEGMRVGRTFFEERFPAEVRYHDSGTTESVFPGGGTVPWAYGGFSVEARDGQGGWIASAADYLRFVHAVDGRGERPDVVEPGVVEWINTRPAGPVFEGTTSWYSGFSVRPQSGGHFWSHSGALPGTRTILIHRPDGVSYVVFLNAQGSSPSEVASELGVFLGDPLREIRSWPEHDLFEAHPAEAHPEARPSRAHPTEARPDARPSRAHPPEAGSNR